MINIYPKTSCYFEGLDKLMPYVEKYKGIELQYFDENGPMERFDLATPVEKLMEQVPFLKEITIHPPLVDYDIELILMKDKTILEEQLKTLVELSKKYNIKMNMVYHTMINFRKHEVLTIPTIKEMMKILEGSDVRLLLENIFMFAEKDCSVFKICEAVDSPNLKVCFDVCHLYCRTNIDQADVEDYASRYLDKELCGKHIYQVHFADTKFRDGFRDHKKSHGRRHESIGGVVYDYDLMSRYNMGNCNYITEVSEDDYTTRVDQIQELVWLDEVANGERK